MNTQALIFDIKRDCSEDGPGIRTTVFFKGCPLRCDWCQNPEGKTDRAQLYFDKQLCKPNDCGAPCVKACPSRCLQANGKLNINFNACINSGTANTNKICRKCATSCTSKALRVSGYWISLDELLYRVLIDKKFYQSSGGGVTLSGGEPTRQMQFIHQFLKALKRAGINTAIETSGFFNYRKFQRLVLPYIDQVYFDLKLMDDNLSWKYLGQSNRLILKNFERLSRNNMVSMIPRIPLIPGITATNSNLHRIAEFLKKCSVSSATLIPYNPLWRDKLDKLNVSSPYKRQLFMSSEELDNSVREFGNS